MILFMQEEATVIHFVQEQLAQIQKLEIYVKIIISILGLFAGLFAGLWAYTKFILERGLVPPAELDISIGTIEKKEDLPTVVEIRPRIRNLGSAVLVISPIEIDVDFTESVLSLTRFDSKEIFRKPYLAGRAKFPKSLRQYSKSKKNLLVLPYKTFINPQVEQHYSFIAYLPKNVSLIRVFCRFHYCKSPSKLMLYIFCLSRFFGLVQFTLNDIRQPHTCERMFSLDQETRRLS